MNNQQLTLTRLLGKKEAWCDSDEFLDFATLSDLHRWMNENMNMKWICWNQDDSYITWTVDAKSMYIIPYDSSKDLLDQSPETLDRIIELIANNQ